MLINRLAEPYDECIDTSSGKHDFTRNVYEELYPETLYSLEVITYHTVFTTCLLEADRISTTATVSAPKLCKNTEEFLSGFGFGQESFGQATVSSVAEVVMHQGCICQSLSHVAYYERRISLDSH